MASQTLDNTTTIDCAQPRVNEVIEQARELLSQLNVARRATEQRLSEAGRVDPIKSITGQSSIEAAIARTESLISTMNELSDSGPRRADSPIVYTNGHACRMALHASAAGGNGRALSMTIPAIAAESR